jgi:hypothetical protein
MVTAEEKGIQSITGDGLMDSVMVNYDALDWTVGFCRKVRDGIPRDDIEGWLIYSGYIQVMGLDVEGILQQLSRLTDRDAWAEKPPFDFWRRAILKVACRRPDGGLEFCRPGHRIPDALPIDSVFFTPDPAMIPYYDITESMKREGCRRGVKLRELLFQYNGKVIRSASALADMVLNRDLEPRRVCDALDRWRDSLADRIHTGAAVTQDPVEVAGTEGEPEAPGADEDFHTPESFQGQLIAGAELAKFLGRASKTLRRWDQLGYVPSGKKWIPGRKVSGNLIVYELAPNWPAIQSMIRRGRDDRSDKQIANELGKLSVDAVDWNIEKDEE